MELDKLTEKEKETILVLTKGLKTQYDLGYGKNRIMAKSTASEIVNHLKELRIIEVKDEDVFRGRPRKFYGLTFLGLHLALTMDFVSPKEAYSIFKQHKIRLPPFTEEFRAKEQKRLELEVPLIKEVAVSYDDIENVLRELIRIFPVLFFSHLRRHFNLHSCKSFDKYLGLFYTFSLILFVRICLNPNHLSAIRESEVLQDILEKLSQSGGIFKLDETMFESE